MIPRRLLLVLLPLLATAAGCGQRVDPSIYGKFESAQQAFERASSPDEFRRAAAMFQEILDAGVVSGAVLYNQGNAFMKAGMRGHAIASYRQAKRYRPRDPHLQANLRFALDRSLPPKDRSFLSYLFFWQDWISYPSKFWWSQWAAMLTLVLASAGFWWQRRGLRRAALVGLGFTFVMFASAGYDWYRYDYLTHGVIVSKSTVARKGNGETYQPAFNQPLAESTEFVLQSRRGDWLEIRLREEQVAWIPARDAVIY